MPAPFTQFSRGQILLLDGATGTELQKRGVPMNHAVWSATATLTHPEILRQIHLDYIEAGAQLIIANTFSTSRHLLSQAGMEKDFVRLNRRAVQIAREAREVSAQSGVLVAASISPENFVFNPPPVSLAKDFFAEQSEIYAKAGADLIMLEMMREVEYTQAALDAARSCGLPVWVGLSCQVDPVGEVRMWGGRTTLEQVVQNLDLAKEETLISIMHTLTENIEPSLEVLKRNWDGYTGVYAHSGKFMMPDWQFIDMISPADYAATARGWLDLGVQMVGGCCGIGPDHIRELRSMIALRSTQET